MRFTIAIYLLVSSLHWAVADETVVKYHKDLPGTGKVILVMSYISNKVEKVGDITATDLTLSLQHADGTKEVLWNIIPLKEKHPSTFTSPIPFDDYAYTTIIDIYFEKNHCTVLFSDPNNMRFVSLQKTGDKWSEKQTVLLRGITYEQKIKSIRVSGIDTVEVKRDAGLDIYKFLPNGSMNKNGVPYENKRPRMGVIKVP